MGVKIFDLLQPRQISLEQLKGKAIAIDAHLVLYQFLSTIRQPDGTPLTDSSGKVTSHLQGLFSRTSNLMQKGIRLAFVFDGKPPELKKKEQMKRAELKAEAGKELKKATKEQDIELMRKYAARTSRLDSEMISEAKELLRLMGIPVVQAPSEGEAQAARIVSDGKAFAVGSQDADTMMFGAPRLVKNLTVSERRRLPNKLSSVQVVPELFELREILSSLGIAQDQLIAIGILVGTDYNRGGVRGIGCKKALKLVKQHKNLDDAFKEARWKDSDGVSWKEIFDTIKNIPTLDDYSLQWGRVDEEGIVSLLCGKHDFSEERIRSTLSKLKSSENLQQGLGRWT